MSGPSIRRLYYSSGEIVEIAQIKLHILSGWESQFPQLKPLARGGRRLFSPGDLQTILKIKELKDRGYSNEKIREVLFPPKARGSKASTLKEIPAADGASEKMNAGLIAWILSELREILKSVQP